MTSSLGSKNWVFVLLVQVETRYMWMRESFSKICFSFHHSVPNQPPDFKAESFSPYTINISWPHVGNETINGEQYLYYIYYRVLKGTDTQRNWQVIGTGGNNITLFDLEPFTLYGVRMTVSSTLGNGVASQEKEVMTLEGGKIILTQEQKKYRL